jgi:hypothetical protein
MSVQQLRSPAVVGHVGAARNAIDQARSVPMGSLMEAELPEALKELAALEAQVSALKHEVLAESEAREIAAAEGATGTDAWAAALTGTSRGVMSGGILLARLLREKYHATREAFASGRINEAQMRVIVRAAEDIPDRATPAQIEAAEKGLVEKAIAGRSPRTLRRAGLRMLEQVDKELADEHEASSLDKSERRSELETWLSMWDNGNGTFSGKFTIPELHGNMLKSALERLSSPRRWTRNKDGEDVEDDTLPGMGPGLNYTEHLGYAFCELIEHLPDHGYGSLGVNVMVTLDYQHLLDGLGGARLDSGARISASEARRLACNAGIIPVVLGGTSQPLDYGRKRRLHSEAQRHALNLSYDSCAAEGCDRPFAWCEVHHPIPWAMGGRTDLDNAQPLCGWHHRRAHDEHYRVKQLPNGEVRFRRRQ